MKVTLINHSSLLFKISNYTFLTDFWNESPAFGSWLPSALPFYNPTYLASLSYNKNFFLVISHAHDDHIDDYFISKYFNKEVNIIINKFPSPSLKKRLGRMGFKNIISIEDKITDFKDFQIISIFDENLSNDDCGLTFRDEKYCIHHGNDNWFKLNTVNIKKLKEFSLNRKFLYASQTNSAAGHPLTYPQYENSNKILKEKVKKMLVAGLENIEDIEADYFLPYAGYSKAYVKNQTYEFDSFNPTYENLVDLVKNDNIQNIDKMLNIFPGGTINLDDGKVEYPFEFNPNKLIEITDKFLKNESIINKCDTFRKDFIDIIKDEKEISDYLLKFNNFVLDYLDRYPNFYSTIIGKKIKFRITNDDSAEISSAIEIGTGNYLSNEEGVNKEFLIPNKLFKALLDKKIIFENLYTGFHAKVFRYPIEKHNRDIIRYINMFGYKYKNQKD